MGIFSSLKRLLFASESVAKSAADKSVDYVKEQAIEIKEKAKDFIEDAGEKTSGLRESIMEKAGKGLETAKDFAGDIGEKAKEVAAKVDQKIDEKLEELGQNETVRKAMDFTEDLGAKVMSKGEELGHKAMDLAENVGSKVLSATESLMDKGEELADKAAEKGSSLSETIGKKLGQAKEDLVEKAKIAADKIEQKYEELADKAVKEAEIEKATPKKEFSDKTLTTGGSLMEGKDDFFSKAADFASGKYDAFKEKVEDTVEDIKAKFDGPIAPVQLPTDEVDDAADEIVSSVSAPVIETVETASSEAPAAVVVDEVPATSATVPAESPVVAETAEVVSETAQEVEDAMEETAAAVDASSDATTDAGATSEETLEGQDEKPTDPGQPA